MIPYDIIGDIHGHYDKLTVLLTKLGYTPDQGTWSHPAGRKVVFLGDFIDRGPQIRHVLQLVRRMCETGHALAVMGNHEYNAVCFHTLGETGEWLRPRSGRNRQQHAVTLAEFWDQREEWGNWVEWFKTLPFCLDLGGIRAVHACWHPAEMEVIAGRTLQDPDFLAATAKAGTPEFQALETLLKGMVVPLPPGAIYHDKEGHPRRTIRARWWNENPTGQTYRGLIFPPADTPPDTPVPEEVAALMPGYPREAPPVFVGHYWLPATNTPGPLLPNLACLDYSAANGGPMVAYRWDGEALLDPQKFLTAHGGPISALPISTQAEVNAGKAFKPHTLREAALHP
jgi:hypothetical protein